VHADTAVIVALVAAAAVAQSLTPLFGHRTILGTLKVLLAPFAVATPISPTSCCS